MTTNVNVFAQGAMKYVFWAKKDGTGVYPYGATGTIANGADASMQRYEASAAFTPAIPARDITPILGDGGNKGVIFSQSLENVTGVLSFNAVDQNFIANANGLTLYTLDDHDILPLINQCLTFSDMAMVINLHATSLESASADEDKWLVIELFNVEAETTLEAYSGTEFDPVGVTFNLVMEEVTKTLYGELTSANLGETKVWGVMYWSENPVCYHTHVGDGADTGVTLSYTAAADNGSKVHAWTDGTAMTYNASPTLSTQFSIVGTAFTFGAATGAGEVTVIRYEFADSC